MESSRVVRIFRVIDHLADFSEGRSLSEIARHLSFPVSSTHDLLQALVAAEILTISSRSYTLGPRAVAVGVRLAAAVDVRRISRVHLVELVDTLSDDVYLAIASGGTVMYVDHHRGTRGVTVSIPLGRPLHLHSTAVGKLYAAYVSAFCEKALEAGLERYTEFTITDRKAFVKELESIRTEEVSISRQESFDGIVGVAVPVVDAAHELRAAVHVSTLVSPSLETRLESIVPVLKDTARKISRDLSGLVADGYVR
ncbi:MAG: IclR family transcriptional regulator [Candidatus Dormibacteria bacterium]